MEIPKEPDQETLDIVFKNGANLRVKCVRRVFLKEGQLVAVVDPAGSPGTGGWSLDEISSWRWW